MIEVEQAVKLAKEAAKKVYADCEVRDVLLEEVEIPENNSDSWLITLSFILAPSTNSDSIQAQAVLGALASIGRKRIYKVFEIGKDTGELRSMKIRTLNPYESVPQ